MLKLSSTQKTVVKVRVPNERGGFTKVDLPAVFKIKTREEFIDMAAELIGGGVVDVDDDELEEASASSIPMRMRTMSSKMTEVLNEVFVGVPEGTKIQADDREISDRDEIKEICVTNPFTSKALFDHYASMMQPEERVKN